MKDKVSNVKYPKSLYIYSLLFSARAGSICLYCTLSFFIKKNVFQPLGRSIKNPNQIDDEIIETIIEKWEKTFSKKAKKNISLNKLINVLTPNTLDNNIKIFLITENAPNSNNISVIVILNLKESKIGKKYKIAPKRKAKKILTIDMKVTTLFCDFFLSIETDLFSNRFSINISKAKDQKVNRTKKIGVKISA